MKQQVLRIVTFVGIALACLPSAVAQKISSEVRGDTTVWHVDGPNVRQAHTEYPRIRVQLGDQIKVTAGGCVQTGGVGATWKRYVDARGGPGIMYSGTVRMNGYSAGYKWVPIKEIIGKHLHYADF